MSLYDLSFALNLGHNGDVCPLDTGKDEHSDRITITVSAQLSHLEARSVTIFTLL